MFISVVRASIVVCSAFVVVACSGGSKGDFALPPQPLSLPSPTGATTPNLAYTADGGLLLSWVAPDPAGHALHFSRWREGEWESPRTIAAGGPWFVNWADFASMVALPNGMLAAHWLRKSADLTYAYDVMVSFSADDGEHWSAPLSPHRDGTPTEHGFVSLLADGDDLGVVWLDGRKMQGGGHGEASGESAEEAHSGAGMSLRYARVAANGNLFDEVELDELTCDCCQTGAIVSGGEPLVVYRDRSHDEIRDIYHTARSDGQWQPPAPISADGWRIAGCPVNGPAIAGQARQVAVAWFTAAADRPQVLASFSHDGGASFAPTMQVDSGRPIGRTAVAMLPDGSAAVSWLGEDEDGAGALFVRHIGPEGPLGEPLHVAAMSAARASGFPRLVLHENALLFVWTEPGERHRLRGARMPLRAL